MTTKQESLASLRLPDLQARYAEVVGETTRSPNKKYLIRRITETLASQAAVAADDATADDAPTADADVTLATTEPDVATREDETTAQSTALDAVEAQDEDTDTAAGDDADTPAETGKPLRELSISQLQQCYLDVVGRPTGSSHRGYLIWKIREAQKGRIPVGPRTRRSPNEPAPDYKILPLRMDAELVERLDDARERLGLTSRMDLFRKALSAYLAAEGEHDLAEALVPGA